MFSFLVYSDAATSCKYSIEVETREKQSIKID
nr:MAG TPA: hypothetical protein [Caudoviricetes sp.]